MGGQTRYANAVDFLGQWYQFCLQRAPFVGQEDVNIFPVCYLLLANRPAAQFHRTNYGESGGFHNADLVAQLLLCEAVALPQYAQKCPVTKWHIVLKEPQLQRALKRARCVLHKVRKTIIGNGFAPVVKDRL